MKMRGPELALAAVWTMAAKIHRAGEGHTLPPRAGQVPVSVTLTLDQSHPLCREPLAVLISKQAPKELGSFLHTAII